MKGRLFWKILAAFGITMVCMLQLVWVAYYILWGSESSYERDVAESTSAYQLAVGRLAIEAGGLPRLTREVATWTPVERMRLRAVPAGENHASAGTDERRVSAIDPARNAWTLIYQLPPAQKGGRSDLGHFWRYMPLEWSLPAFVGGLAFSTALAWYLTRPIRRLQAGFRDLANGELGTRLGSDMGRRRDELADLANDFDRMAERLQHLVEARERILHDVSHELRSPLARLSLAVALLRQWGGGDDASLDRIDSEVSRLDALVGELLSLSRQESGEVDTDAYFDMVALVGVVVDDARFEAAAKHVALAWETHRNQSVILQGSAELIRRALENVVRNAVQVSTEGQRIDVQLHVLTGAVRRVRVTVADRGQGVPEDKLQAMLEPFVRLSAVGGGYGLGLSIARRAVNSHGGSIVATRREGGGLVMALTLPVGSIDPSVLDNVQDVP